MNLTISQLHAELGRLLYSHPLAETNVEGILNVGADIHFDTYGLAYELAKDEISDLEKQVKQLEQSEREADQRADAAEDLMQEFKDEGGDLQTYRKRAEDAEDMAKSYLKRADKAEADLKVLRARKGIDANYLRLRSDVITLIGYLAYDGHKDLNHFREDAKKLRARLNA